MSDQEQNEQKAQAMIRAVYMDGFAEINGRKYTFHKMTHKQRRKVFAFYTHVGPQVKQSDFSFLEYPEFEKVEEIINKSVSCEGSLLSVIGDEHWEKHPDDYLKFIGTALPVVSYPFFQGNSTN